MARRIALVLLLASLDCGGNATPSAKDSSTAVPTRAAATGGVDLTGAGATFPYPIFSKWFSDYAASTGVKINYQSIGSGGGIRQLSEQTVDFGASDAPMTDAEIAKAKGGNVLHFPTVLGAVVVTYNLPELTAQLRLSGGVLADIFLGKIVRWNDPRIAAINPAAPLPARSILIVHRTDGSGTTFIFSDYLSAISTAWATGPGRGKDLKWPVGLGGRGNEGVAGAVKQTIGALGYVELAYARQNRLPAASLQNASGAYVTPSVASITAAAAGAATVMGPASDYRISLVNGAGASAYPVSSFSWLLVYQHQMDATKGRKLVDFMRWMYGTGQESAATLDYAPLPAALAAQLTARLATVQFGGGAR